MEAQVPLIFKFESSDYARDPTNSRHERTSGGILPSVYFLSPPWGIFFAKLSTKSCAVLALLSKGNPKSTAFLTDWLSIREV